jgi:hypothetical protein
METSVENKTIREYNTLAIGSLVMGLLTLLFPIISIFFLVEENGGPGYLQSLICGIHVTFASIITRIVSLVQIRKEPQKGSRMAVLGIVFGTSSLVITGIMVIILLAPFFFEAAQ